jgi:DNA-binding winged helix-turn-helix (wHTH) protein/TolB-like protein
MSVRFRFGLFEFDDESLDLRRDGTVVHLQAQPKQVLACLLRNADRTVSREELKQIVWGDQTFVDFERGLNFCISQIRSSLDDDAARPVYIRTFARQGYQFIAPVERIGLPKEASPSPAVSPLLGWQRWLAAGAMTLLIAVGISANYLMKPLPVQPQVIAVVRFDNETGNADMTRFSDALTDDVVERLTSLSAGHYEVIGNAQILRLPREQRNLATIASSLHANFVVLGQVQAHGGQVRILAHLIRMPEQTHVWVTRLDRTVGNPLDVQSQAAQTIGSQFWIRLANSGAASLAVASR